ncbi:hypothetical protein GGR23_004231 [Gellertiella hungarica]|uniref:Uncharacterized protein n=1 Tax=Gellertiella hungarica TaxID=1572859 RepID=A0A7W6J909_9HYPH|nr:hypothetical protein [Gellertiella hungarica]
MRFTYKRTTKAATTEVDVEIKDGLIVGVLHLIASFFK